MAGWIALALWMSAHSTAVPPAAFNRVRSPESRLRTLIAEGYAQSEAFKELVDEIERRPCIVYVTTAFRLSQGMRGALLHSSVGLPDMPVLRVAVIRNLSRDEAISVIAHELQHVLEAVEGAPLPGAVPMTAIFDTLDPTARARGSRKYETDAAVAVTRKVRDELRRASREPRRLRMHEPAADRRSPDGGS